MPKPDPTFLAPSWLDALLTPAAYPHPCADIRLLETHISWLLLTGDWAYKVKKPVAFGFLDFSDLERRKQACDEELRLNRRLAAVYDAVVTIGGDLQHPRVGELPALEYAVRMRQFDPEQGFDRLVERGELAAELVTQLAAQIADFHHHCPRAGLDSAWGTAAAVVKPMLDNFPPIREGLSESDSGSERKQLEQLQQWTVQQADNHGALLTERRRDGWVRECHGDLHLGNIVRWQGAPLVFDCIEFNAGLRWIDTISEQAFLMMSMDHAGRSDLGWLYLNRYLELTGDYAAVVLLRFYQTYRALVRAKVAALRGRQAAVDEPNAVPGLRQAVRDYLQLASTYAGPQMGALLITHGVSGSGKTTLTTPLLARLGAVRLRSDVERKRLFGLGPEQVSSTTQRAELYSADASRRTYALLLEQARALLAAGHTVIVEATFLTADHRQPFADMARELSAPCLVLAFSAPPATLAERIEQRAQRGDDASEADVSVMQAQQDVVEPPSGNELATSLFVDSCSDGDLEQCADRLAEQVSARLSAFADQGAPIRS